MSFPRYPKYKPSGVEWLGEVPEHWETVPLKSVATHNDEVLDETTDPNTEIVYVDISSVDGINGISAKESMLFSGAPSRARRRVRHGDVIVSTVRTYLRAIAQINNPESNLIVSTGFAVIRPKSRLVTEFLGCLLSASYFVEQVIARSTGVSYPAINATELVSIPVVIPSLPEQTAIASFLDHETGKIDVLVEEQRRLIALLKEKRQAVISHAVTKGLNPHAPMKPSGVEWLGDVPEHWSVVPLRWSSSCCSGGSLSADDVEQTKDDGHVVPVIGGNGIMGYTREGNIDHEVLAVGRVGALCGNVHIVSPPAWVTDNALILDPDLKIFDLRFLSAVLRIRKLNDIAAKTAQPLITGTQVSDQRMPAPSLLEQREIASFLDTETAQFDTLTAEANRAIDLLQERRTALISAAVTGKIDVRSFTKNEAA